MVGTYHKVYLPNYGVLMKTATSGGKRILVCEREETVFGVNICEDIWYPWGSDAHPGPQGGAQIIVNISSSPYHAGKWDFRQKMLSTRAWDYAAIVAYVNLVGGQDELVFDGGSMVLDQRGQLIAMAKVFAEDLLVVDLNLDDVLSEPPP